MLMGQRVDGRYAEKQKPVARLFQGRKDEGGRQTGRSEVRVKVQAGAARWRRAKFQKCVECSGNSGESLLLLVPLIDIRLKK